MGTLKKRFFTSADPVIRRSLGFCRWLLEIDCSDFELKRKQHQLFSFVLMSELVWTNSYLTQEFFWIRAYPSGQFLFKHVLREKSHKTIFRMRLQNSRLHVHSLSNYASRQRVHYRQFSVFSPLPSMFATNWLGSLLERQDLILSLVFRFRRDFRN